MATVLARVQTPTKWQAFLVDRYNFWFFIITYYYIFIITHYCVIITPLLRHYYTSSSAFFFCWKIWILSLSLCDFFSICVADTLLLGFTCIAIPDIWPLPVHLYFSRKRFFRITLPGPITGSAPATQGNACVLWTVGTNCRQMLVFAVVYV